MGKQKGIYLEGKSGNILYYSWKGIPCERTIPAQVYQSPVVVAHKSANGLATTMGGSFRKLLCDVIPYSKDMKMQTAVRLALLKWLKGGSAPWQASEGIPHIGGLSFNEAAMLEDCLRLPLSISVRAPNELSVLIPQLVPATAFTAPPQTDHIRLKLAAACCNIQTGEALQNHTNHISIPYNAENRPSQTITLPLQMPTDSLTMAVVALEYFTNKNGTASLILDERFRPTQAIGGVVTRS